MDQFGELEKEKKHDREQIKQPISINKKEDKMMEELGPLFKESDHIEAQGNVQVQEANIFQGFEIKKMEEEPRSVRERLQCQIQLSQVINKRKDSSYMQEVKQAVGELAQITEGNILENGNLFSLKEDGDAIHKRLNEIEGKYMAAIEKCQTYLEKREPSFFVPKTRYNTVKNTMKLLQQELDYMTQLRLDMTENPENYENYVNMSILDLIYNMRIQKELDQGTDKLELKDFAQMITQNEEDSIICRNGKLYRKGALKSDNNQGAITMENFQMIDRMVGLLLQRQDFSEPEEFERMRRNILRGLGVDAKNQVSGPISMSRIRHLLVKFNRYTSKVDQVLQEEKASAKLSKEEQSLEYRTASQIDSLLGNAFDDQLTKTAKKKEYTRTARAFQDFWNQKILGKKEASLQARLDLEAKMKEQIKSILQTCEKNKNYTVLKPSDEDLNILLHGRMQAVRDRAYETVQRIYESKKRLKQNPVQELDKREMQELMGLILTEAMAKSAEAKLAASLQIQKYTESRIMNGDLELEKSLTAINTQEFEGVAVSEIRNYVLANPKQWKTMKPADREAALAAVLRIVGNTQEISLLSHKGLYKGLSEEEAAVLEKRVAENSAIYTQNEKQIEKLQKGFPANSAIHQGLKRLKLKKLSNFGVLSAKVATGKLKIEKEQPAEGQKKKESVQIMTETEALKYAMYDFDPKTTVIITALFLDQQPSKLIQKSGDTRSTELIKLHDALKEMALLSKDQKNAERTLKLNGVNMLLKQDASGILTLSVGGKEVTLPQNAGSLADMMELNLCDNFDRYKNDEARKLLLDSAIRDENKNNAYGGSRVVYERFLTYHLGISAEKLANVEVYVLRILTKQYCTDPKLFNKDKIAKQVDDYAKNNMGKLHINSSAAVENLIALENLKELKQVAQAKREEHEQEAKPLAVKDKEEWSPKEKNYLNLVSDLLFLRKTTDAQDLENPLTAETLKSVLSSRKKELLEVLNMDSGDRWQVRMRLSFIPNFGKAVVAADDLINKIAAKCGKGQVTEEDIDAVLEAKELKKDLGDCAKEMIETVEKSSTYIQGILKTMADNLTEDNDDNWKQLSDYTISELVEKGLTGDEGEGAFNRKVLSGYIEKAAFSDKMRMVSAALRNMPKIGQDDLQELGEKGIGNKIMSGYIKGAGPLLHKMLQGLPVSSMDESMQEMVADVRSRLMEIDEELVDGQLQQIINEANGSIDHIEKVKVLGAASVGQTVLVKVFETGKKKGVEKVVKILRPDVQNYIDREKAFMEGCAKEVDEEVYRKKHGHAPAEGYKGGMLKTYLGKEKAILRELDLRLEADNVEKGSIYEDELLNIRSMKLDKNTKSTVQTIVLEKAKGVSVDKFIDNKNEIRDKLEKEATQAKDKSQVHIYKSIDDLQALRKDLKTKQQYLVNLTTKWLDEAIFNTGFFHGDLHAGNIMMDDEGITIIDYGNASKLKPKEQIAILNLLAAAARFNDTRVIKHIRSMLSPEANRIFERKKTDLSANIATIVKKEDGMPVQTILAVLNELQKEEIEIPEGLYNFIQCFVRIVGTLTDYKNLINNVDKSIENVMRSEQRGEVANNPEIDIMAPVMKKILVRVDKKKGSEAKKKETIEGVVETAMHNKEVDMELLQSFCDTKEDTETKAFNKICEEEHKMQDVVRLVNKVNSCYVDLFHDKRPTLAVHDLRYAEKFEVSEALEVVGWFNEKAMTMMKTFEAAKDSNIDAQKNLIGVFTEEIQNSQDPEDIATFNKNIEDCKAILERNTAEKAKILPLLDALKERMALIKKDLEAGQLDRKALNEVVDDTYKAAKEIMCLGVTDNDEKEFISCMLDLSVTARPKKKEKITDKLKEDRENARKKLEHIANKIHKKSNPKSYAEEMVEALKRDASYEKLGKSLKDWFDDSANHGEELRIAYLNVGKAKKKGTFDATSLEAKAFIKALQDSITARCAQIEKAAEEKNKKDESGDEDKAIENLLKSNLVMSLLSLDGKGLPYLYEYKLKDSEKKRLAQEKKERKSKHMEKFYGSLCNVELPKAVKKLINDTKKYERVMERMRVNKDDLKPSEKEVKEVKEKINVAFNNILGAIAKIDFYPGAQKKMDKYFKALEEKTNSDNLLRILHAVGEYIEESLEGTSYTDVKEGEELRDIDKVYDDKIKDFDIIPDEKYLRTMTLKENFGDDGKPIPLKERLKKGEEIKWVV